MRADFAKLRISRPDRRVDKIPSAISEVRDGGRLNATVIVSVAEVMSPVDFLPASALRISENEGPTAIDFQVSDRELDVRTKRGFD